MSVPKVSVLPILSTPLGIVQLPAAEVLNSTLAALFVANRQETMPPGANVGWHGQDDLFQRTEPSVRELSAEIIRGVYSVIDSVNNFPPGQLQSFTLQARGWASILRQNGSVPASHFPLTAWCAIYCVAAPAPASTRADSGVLRLHESRLGTMFHDATNATMRIPFTLGHFTWRPVPGQLAVFPAYLTHEIAPLRSLGELIPVTSRLRFVAACQNGFSRW